MSIGKQSLGRIAVIGFAAWGWLFAGGSALAQDASDPHAFTVKDLLAMQRVGDLSGSIMGGTRLAFSVRTTDIEANKGTYDIWVSNTTGGSSVLTTNPANDTAPQLAHDDTAVLFLSNRSGSNQVWTMPLVHGGEPTQVTDLPVDVDGFRLIGLHDRLLLAMEVYPDAADLAESVARDEAKAKSKVKARIYDELLFRHWDQWEDGKRSHWFVYDIRSKKLTDLMKGMDCDAPTKPFGGTEEAAVAPNGKYAVFATQNVGREAAWSTNVDLYVATLDGSAPPVCITKDNQALDNTPAYSPDGSRIAYLAMKRPMYEADRQGVWVMDVANAKATEIAPQWDRSASSLTWSVDGKSLYVTADHVGNTGLFSIDVASGKVTPLVEKGSVSSPVALLSGVAFLWNDLKHPDRVEFIDLQGKRREIADPNRDALRSIAFGDYEQFEFQGAHGDTVHGYVSWPVGFDKAKKYPVAFLIHGGPQGTFSDRFHYRWNPQIYAGHGYATVFVDFHGSTGYGQAFTDAIRGDWGGAPYEDLMKGLDAALAKYPFLDASRVAALGASYGGYMINWIAGQTDRFRCLVNHDGNIDERMAYFDTEELWFPEWEHHGAPWENPESYTKHNPIDFVKNWKTPMLVIHGGNDFRVVDTQGMGTFTALQRKGIPSKFLHFPDENHWVLKPQNSILWHDTVLSWIDQFTK